MRYIPEEIIELLAMAVRTPATGYGGIEDYDSASEGGTLVVFLDAVAAGSKLQVILQESYDDPGDGSGHWADTAAAGTPGDEIVAIGDGAVHVPFAWTPSPRIRAKYVLDVADVTFRVLFVPNMRRREYT